MAFDAHKNLAITTVLTAPTPATSGTTLTVAAGEGARFPAAPFNATVWPVNTIPTPVNAEVVRVTARTGDTLTITRAQEGTTARSIIAGDLIAETITAKVLTDIESGTNFPLIAVAGTPGVAGSVAAHTLQGAQFLTVRTNTTAGADNGWATICGAAVADSARGAYMQLSGNQSSIAGAFRFFAGNMPLGRLEFWTANDQLRGIMHNSGGFSWGNTPDPGAGNISAGAFTVGSDARLKIDRGRHTDPEVLRRTIIHTFDWIADGRPGRGVFAQEAQAVAPFAVVVGRDEVDAEGRLVQPWGVDYSKYVPDLITGWQAHEAEIAGLAERLAAIDHGYVTIRLPHPTSGTVFRSIRMALRQVGNFITAFWRPSWV